MYHPDFSLWDEIDRVTVHFPPGADAALRYTSPTTGREGQFSIEYIVYQVLAYGAVQDELFKIDIIDSSIRDYMSRIERVYDLPKSIPNRADYESNRYIEKWRYFHRNGEQSERITE